MGRFFDGTAVRRAWIVGLVLTGVFFLTGCSREAGRTLSGEESSVGVPETGGLESGSLDSGAEAEGLSGDESGAVDVATGDAAEFDAFVGELDRLRKQNLSWTREEWEAFDTWMPDYSDQLDVYSEEEMRLLAERREPRAVFAEEAREDVESFFKLIQTTYGGYDYFGGDEMFLPVRDRVIGRLTGEGEIAANELEELLCAELRGVVKDGHFLVGSQSLIEEERRFMYYVPDLYFDGAEGTDPAYVRPTIGPEGELDWCFAALSHDGADLPRTAPGPDGETVELDWVKAQPFEGWSEDGFIPYERKNVDGLPVLVCETLDDTSGEEHVKPMLEFLGRSGAEYRDLPVFAADLRGNWGGNDGYAQQWMDGFTGMWPRTKLAGGVKFSQLCMAVRGEYESLRQEQLGASEGEWGVVKANGSCMPGGSLVFLLTDYGTASSGEDFASYLRSVDRVVTVGSNTAGCQSFGNVMDFYLPHSGLRVRCGAGFFFWDSFENREGTGYLPDLWVNPPQALDAVTRLCDYYGLK